MNLSSVDLNLLLAFDALMTHRNVTSAGAAIGLTQPAMSNALSRLRRVFNDPLFIRGGGSMTPTSRAQAAHPAVRTALDQIQGALDGVENFDAKSANRVFHVAIAEDAAFYILPRLMERLGLEAPGIDLKILSTAYVPGYQLVADGTAELAVGIAPHKLPKELAMRTIFRERIVCIGRHGHPALRKLTLERFVAARHVSVQPSVRGASRVDVALGALGHSRRVALSVPHFLMVPFLLPGTDMLGVVAERVALHFAPIVGLEIRPLPFVVPDYQPAMVWHRSYERDAGHTWLRKVIAAVSARLSSPPH